mgnify:CR=1 FL=1
MGAFYVLLSLRNREKYYERFVITDYFTFYNNHELFNIALIKANTCNYFVN